MKWTTSSHIVLDFKRNSAIEIYLGGKSQPAIVIELKLFKRIKISFITALLVIVILVASPNVMEMVM